MPNSLQLGPAPCSSQHHSCVSEAGGQGTRATAGGRPRQSPPSSGPSGRATRAWDAVSGRAAGWAESSWPAPPGASPHLSAILLPFHKVDPASVRVATLPWSLSPVRSKSSRAQPDLSRQSGAAHLLPHAAAPSPSGLASRQQTQDPCFRGAGPPLTQIPTAFPPAVGLSGGLEGRERAQRRLWEVGRRAGPTDEAGLPGAKGDHMVAPPLHP